MRKVIWIAPALLWLAGCSKDRSTRPMLLRRLHPGPVRRLRKSWRHPRRLQNNRPHALRP